MAYRDSDGATYQTGPHIVSANVEGGSGPASTGPFHWPVPLACPLAGLTSRVDWRHHQRLCARADADAPIAAVR